MIKKVEKILAGGQTGQYLKIGVWCSSHFLLINTHQPHQSCRTGTFGCFTTFHQISRRNIYRKILFLKKI